jgi:hypothetical protein
MKHLIFALSVLLGLTGAAWPLNPLVTRAAQPSGPVPAECEEGLAPTPMPRVNVAEIPAPEVVPASIPAPPSSTLRSTLEEAHAALVRNDRPAFDAALDNAREIVGDYPPGAERTNAEEAVRAYDDAAFVWNAQFTSPFFDQNSEAYARVSRYPGYAEAVRRGVFTDDRERRFYPAAESRDFLTRVASERLGRLGIRTTTRIARAERPRSAPVVSPPPTHRRSTARRAASTVTTTRTPTHHPQSRKSATPAISAPASPDPPASTRAVTESAPAAPPKASAPTPAAPASPAAEGQPVDDTPAPAVATTPEPSPAAVPDTVAPAPATTTTTAPAAAPAERRSVIIPALLILIGLGVLIVLFRVSK